MLRSMAVVRTDISEERIASTVTRIGEMGTTLVIPSVHRLLLSSNVVPDSPNPVTLMMETQRSY
jgi:hypothetical protein